MHLWDTVEQYALEPSHSTLLLSLRQVFMVESCPSNVVLYALKRETALRSWKRGIVA